MVATAWVLLLCNWKDPMVLTLSSAVALAAVHLHPPGLFMVAFLVLSQVTLIGGVIQYLPVDLWLLILVLLNGLLMAGAIGLAGIALRIRAYLYLGTLFLLLDVVDQLVFFSTQYAPAKWIVGFSLGLLLVALAVLFESRWKPCWPGSRHSRRSWHGGSRGVAWLQTLPPAP